MIDQNLLAGNARWSVGNRITSASIKNITKPRNASMDVIRVGAVTPTARGCDTVETGADTVVCMVPGILMRLAFRASIERLNVFFFDPFLTVQPCAGRLPQLC